MLRAVLIDDDESNLSSLSEKLKHCPQVNIISRCDNAQEGMQVIENLKPIRSRNGNAPWLLFVQLIQ